MKIFPLLGNDLEDELILPNKIPADLDWLGEFYNIWNVFKIKTNDYVIIHRYSSFPGPSQVEIPLAAATWVAAQIKALLLPPEQGGKPLDVLTGAQTFNGEEVVVFRCTVFGKKAGFRLYNKSRLDNMDDCPPQTIDLTDSMILENEHAFLTALESLEKYV